MYEWAEYDCQAYYPLTDTDWTPVTDTAAFNSERDAIACLSYLDLICTQTLSITGFTHSSTTDPIIITFAGHLNQDIGNEAFGFSNVNIIAKQIGSAAHTVGGGRALDMYSSTGARSIGFEVQSLWQLLVVLLLSMACIASVVFKCIRVYKNQQMTYSSVRSADSSAFTV